MRPHTLVAVAALALACQKDDPDPGPPPVPALTRVDAELIEAHPGEPVVLRATVRNDDGTPASDYEVYWNATCEVPSEAPEPGVETCRWIPATIGVQPIELRVTVCDGPRWNPTMHCPSTTLTVAWVRVWGGPPKAVSAPVRAASLVVGEARPIQGVVLADRAISHVPPTYTIDHPAIATVDADGVVTALAAGETILRIGASTVEHAVTLTITDDGLGPPPAAEVVAIVSRDDDIVSSNGFAEIGVNLRRDNTVALDDEGRPWLAYRTLSKVAGVAETQVRPAWVSTWTGSGFSYETVGARWDDVYYPQLVVDGRGTAWLLFYSRDQAAYGVMRRLAPGRWERIALPAMSDAAAPRPASGEGVTTRTSEYQSESIPMTLHARASGGADAAYVGWGRATADELAATGHACARFVRLATIDPSGAVHAEDVARALYGDNQPNTDCAAWVSLDQFTLDALFIVPAPDASRAPRVLMVKEQLDEGFARLAWKEGATWRDEQIIPWAEPRSLEAYQQAPVQLTVVRPDDPDDLTVPTRLLWTGRGAFLVDLEALVAGDPEPFGGLSPMTGGGYPGDQVLFATMAGGAIYSGTGTLGPVAVLRPDGAVTLEDPTARLFPVADPYLLEPYHLYTLVRGVAGDTQRLHLTWGQGDLAYAALDVPVFARADDPEPLGRRLGAEPTTPIPTRAPLVLPDGSRRLPTDRGLLGSAGPDAPWSLVRPRDGHRRDDLFLVGATLRGFAQDSPGELDVVGSNDGGATWSTFWTIKLPDEMAPGAAVVTADGVAFVASVGRLWRSTATGTDELATAMARLDHLTVAGSEVIALGFGTDGQVRIARWDSAGALIRAGTPADAPRLDAADLQTAVAAPDGRVCLRTWGATGNGMTLAVVCADATLASFTRFDLPDDAWWDPAPLAILDDGRIAQGATLTHGFEDRRAVIVTLGPSGWGEPVALRPPPVGGHGQRVYGLAEEGDALLALMGDNGSWRAWTGGELLVDGPPYDTLVVRVPARE